jgi:hypothetical protein
MKRLLASLLVLTACFTAGAQTYDVLDVLRSDRRLVSGCEGPYRFDEAVQTPAPKGFKPFYISHYGRHGSRYAWNSATYTVIQKVLETAASVGALTPRGERLFADFTAFYEVPLMNTGDLVELGAQQHKEIARIMAQSFPEVFADGGMVSAMSSTSQRAIVSMNAFCVSLQKYAPKVDIEGNSLHTNMLIVNPNSAPREIRQQRAGKVELPETLDEFRTRKYVYEDVLDRLFTDRGFLEEMGGKTQFLSELAALWRGYHNYCDSDWMEDIFTQEEALAYWEVDNYDCYVGHGGQRYQQMPLVLDIVDRADEAIAGSGYKAHLRFGHDTVVNAICPLLNINGCGYMPDKADDVKYWFQNYDTPMAANIQFILYRSKKDARILFKLLRNGQEATLPQLTPVSGPYYDWNDFRAWVEKLDAEHPVR